MRNARHAHSMYLLYTAQYCTVPVHKSESTPLTNQGGDLLYTRTVTTRLIG